MLNKPKFMSPSTNMPNCVVDIMKNKYSSSDLTGRVTYSCIIDGNEAINKYRLTVCDAITNTQLIFKERGNGSQYGKDSSVFDENGLFYPINEDNENNILSIKMSGYTSGNEVKIVNRKEPYYWTLQAWGTSGSVVTSCEEIFYANTTPEVTITYSEDKSNYNILVDGTILSSRKCYFKGTYTQEEGIPLKRYGWRLTDVDSGQILLDTISHNQIYGTGDNIICTYDGLLNDGNYSIELFVETQNGATVTTDKVDFSVKYETTFLTNDFKVEVLRNEPSVILDWADAKIISGEYKGNISFKPNYPVVDYARQTPNTSVEISDNSSIFFDYDSTANLDISENSYIVLSTQLLNADDRTIFLAEGKDGDDNELIRKLSFVSGGFEYIISNGISSIVKTYVPENLPSKYTWYIITMSPITGDDALDATLRVVEIKAVNGKYPSSMLYPTSSSSETPLYPSFGTWETVKVGEV